MTNTHLVNQIEYISVISMNFLKWRLVDYKVSRKDDILSRKCLPFIHLSV